MDDENHTLQDLLNRMKRAHGRGTGMHISAYEIHALSVSLIGQMWEEEDPRATPPAAGDE